MTRAAAIIRLRQMLAEEISFVEHIERAEGCGDVTDILAYHRNGVNALKMAIKIFLDKQPSA